MASEMINKVLEAEKKAAEREADAKAKAADIIKTAEAEAKAATDAEIKAALEEGDRVVAEAKLQAEAIYSKARADGRNFLIRVTDPKLLEATGGIVQGMSGSPILQNGKIVGAVTHVLVNDPTRGYGIFIENMLDAAG